MTSPISFLAMNESKESVVNNGTKEIKKLRDAIERIVSDIKETEHEGNIREIVEEVAYEFERDLMLPRPKVCRLGQKLPMPLPEAIISYDMDGETVLSRLREEKWWFVRLGEYLHHDFRHQSEEIGIDLLGEMADHLVRFSQLTGWFMLPGNNPGSGVESISSSLTYMKGFRHFIGILMEKGFLLKVIDTEPKPLHMLNVVELKAELRKRMAENRPVIQVKGVFKAVGMWVKMADYIEMPPEFMPGFTIRDWQGDKKLFKEIIHYVAERQTPWEDIPYDDLIRLLQESQVYVQNFSQDVLFMANKVSDVFPVKVACITGKTQQMFDEIVAYTFANDPRTDASWFTLAITKEKPKLSVSRDSIKLCQIEEEVFNLINCCIFLLLFWTAVRVEELTHFKTKGLFINGIRIGRDDNALEVFKGAKGPQGTLKPKFELEYCTFKHSKAKDGEVRKIPMAEDAALAFCILVELFRCCRNSHENPYLFPKGGRMRRRQRKNTPVSRGYISTHLAKLCNKVGIGYQHPHKCRKTLPTIIINKKPDSLEHIQRLLGHRTPTDTLKYLMQIPNIAEPVRQHVLASNKKRILDLLSAASTRRMSGKAGERMMTAIPPEKLVAEILPATIAEYIDLLLADPNFVVVKTPAAWCLRFRSYRPQQLPCLPDIHLIDLRPEDLAPDPSKCRPWLCGYAAHTSHHLKRAKANRDASKKIASKEGIRADLVRSLSHQYEYWGNVVRHVEHGHEAFSEMVPAEAFNSEV
jgi:hypothetical protein